MRRQEINYEKVASVAEKIKKRGKEPSLIAVNLQQFSARAIIVENKGLL